MPPIIALTGAFASALTRPCNRPAMSAYYCLYVLHSIPPQTSEVRHEIAETYAGPGPRVRPSGCRRPAPLNQAQVPADAKWLLHVDVDAMRQASVVQKAWKKGLEMHKEAQQHLDKLKTAIGMDICKDLHGVTAYGMQIGKHTGVLLVNAKVDRKLLLDKAEKAKDHKVVKLGDIDVHSWTQSHQGHTKTVWGAFYKADYLLFASSLEEMKAAIAVLDGKAAALATSSPLAGSVQPGTTLVARVTGLGAVNIPGRCPFAKLTEGFNIGMGENSGQSFLQFKGLMKTPEAADQAKKVMEALKTLASVHVSENAKLQKMVDALQTKADGKTVTVAWSGSANDVWDLMQEHAKRMAEHRGRMGWPPCGCPWAPGGAKPPAAPGKSCTGGDKKPCPAGTQAGSATTAEHQGRWARHVAYILKNLDLTDAQKAKVEELKKEYGPKFKETLKKFGDILTEEQKKARAEAVKSAAAAGKHGKEVWEAVRAAVKLTDEQKAKLAEVRKQLHSLREEAKAKFVPLLTAEQKEKLEKLIKQAKEHKPADK